MPASVGINASPTMDHFNNYILALTTQCPDKKRCHFIFDYSSRISWSIFILFAPMDTAMNTLESHVIYLLNSVMTS